MGCGDDTNTCTLPWVAVQPQALTPVWWVDGWSGVVDGQASGVPLELPRWGGDRGEGQKDNALSARVVPSASAVEERCVTSYPCDGWNPSP